MKIAFLKRLNTRTPDFVKELFAPLIRSKLISNQVYLEQYMELERMDNMTESEIKRIQFQKLKETLIHAYEHTLYYKKLFNECDFDPYAFSDYEEMVRIPILTKDLIRNNFDELQADDIPDYYAATTGGSSGVPLKVHLERDSIYKERAFIYHFWSKFGYDWRSSKIASFRGTDFNGKNFKANPLYREVQFNPVNINAETIHAYWDRINRFGADFLHGFPSAIYSFCKFAAAAGLPLSNRFKAVFFISENVYVFQKEFIEKTLGCPCVAFYGHSERNVFAEQDTGGGYKFNDFYCSWSVTEEKQSNIICTGFLNKRMPLIRYQLDDYAEKNLDRWKITGHRDGFLYGRNNEIISAAQLEVHSNILEKISNYQFFQQEIGKAELLYIPFTPLSEKDRKDLQKLFQIKTRNSITFSVKEVSELILTKRGKYRIIINECK